MRFFTVSGVPKTTGCFNDLEPALAEKIEHGLPVALYFSLF